MTRVPRSVATALLALVVVPAALAQVPAPAQTATQFYKAYRVALAKAATLDEILPLVSTATRARIDQTPAAERPMVFDLIKELAAATGEVTVLKETVVADGVELQVEAVMGTAKTPGKIQIVKENGAWKMGKEMWGSGQ